MPVVTPGPRLFGIPAIRAPVVVVLRRGPSDWSHVGLWRLDPLGYEPGAWLRGHLYPQRCDVSADGLLLAYFALSSGNSWSAGDTYVAVSRLPWLRALAAWGTAGTWSRGVQFTDDPAQWSLPDPQEGDVSPMRGRYGLAVAGAHSFAVERRRGWIETAETPARSARDMWDEGRAAIELRKNRPGGGPDLLVRGQFAAFRSGPADDPDQCSYRVAGAVSTVLEGVQWADWADDGRLLTMTRDGRLQVREQTGTVWRLTWEHDVAALVPEPQPPPQQASIWPWQRA